MQEALSFLKGTGASKDNLEGPDSLSSIDRPATKAEDALGAKHLVRRWAVDSEGESGMGVRTNQPVLCLTRIFAKESGPRRWFGNCFHIG